MIAKGVLLALIVLTLWVIYSVLFLNVINTIPDTLSYTRYSKGVPLIERKIYKGDKEFSDLILLLEESHDPWLPSFVTYAPKKIYSGNHVNINISGNIIIVNTLLYGLIPIQVVKSVKGTD